MARCLITNAPEACGDGLIQPIARALDVLCALNRKPYATLQDLHLATGLPKPTVHRILVTLRHKGYVERDLERSIYRLTAQVQLLSAGFNQRGLLTDVGAEILRATTRKIRWPLAIGTLEGTEIVVRYSTMPYSPFAVTTTTVNNRHGLLDSAMGQAYLAYCCPTEREILIEMMRTGAGVAAPLAQDAERLHRIIAQTRQLGFGLRSGSPSDESATMAVPIVCQTEVLGVLSLTMFRKSFSATMARRHLPVLTDVARQLAERCSIPSSCGDS